MDLGRIASVAGVVTQCRTCCDQCITAYRVLTSTTEATGHGLIVQEYLRAIIIGRVSTARSKIILMHQFRLGLCAGMFKVGKTMYLGDLAFWNAVKAG